MNKISSRSSLRCNSSRKSFQDKCLTLTLDCSEIRSISLKKGIKVLSKQLEIKKSPQQGSKIKKHTEAFIQCGICDNKSFDIKKQLQISMQQKKGDFQSYTLRKKYSNKKISLANPLDLDDQYVKQEQNKSGYKIVPYTPINKLNIF